MQQYYLIPAGDTPTWPKANPTHALPRAIPRRIARAKTGAYLKTFGSRPKGRSEQDRKQSKAVRWLTRMVRAQAT